MAVTPKAPNWTTKSTKVETGTTIVDAKLSTITPSNQQGWTKVSATSTDPILQRMEYAVQNDGQVTYRYTPPAGPRSQPAPVLYNNFQEMARLGGINGFNNQTSLRITDSMQNNLVNRSNQTGATSPVAPQPPAAPGDAPVAGATGITSTSGDAPGFGTDIKGSRINNYDKSLKPLVYPVNRQGYGGDYIQFEIRTYQKSGLASPTASGFSGTKDVTLLGMEKRKYTPLAYIYLPIQSGISDSMSVNWGTGELDPMTAAFANVAYNTITGAGVNGMQGAFAGLSQGAMDLTKSFGNAEPELRQVMINTFTQRAVGVEGLLSRTMGGALNNNLELLFNGPMLRSFTFNFKLTPREPDEARVIKEIIRYFKKSMVPGLSDSKLFLLAPNVFKLKYIYTGKGNIAQSHPYLNKIKVAALRDFSVNYTPDGNYMTYGADGSMTQYDLSMSFGEIDPIYEPDYEEGEGKEGMGW
jgi:hypothetical protein